MFLVVLTQARKPAAHSTDRLPLVCPSRLLLRLRDRLRSVLAPEMARRHLVPFEPTDGPLGNDNPNKCTAGSASLVALGSRCRSLHGVRVAAIAYGRQEVQHAAEHAQPH